MPDPKDPKTIEEPEEDEPTSKEEEALGGHSFDYAPPEGEEEEATGGHSF